MADKKNGAALAILQKGNRTLIVTTPTKRQIKKYKKRDWSIRVVEENAENTTAASTLINQLLALNRIGQELDNIAKPS